MTTQPTNTQASAVPRLKAAWNLDFSNARRANIKRLLRGQSRSNPVGRGNKAWKRFERMQHDPAELRWPDYAL